MNHSSFVNAWEQRKLGDVFKERSERSGVGELISVTINSGVVKFDDLHRHDNSSEDEWNYKRVEAVIPKFSEHFFSFNSLLYCLFISYCIIIMILN